MRFIFLNQSILFLSISAGWNGGFFGEIYGESIRGFSRRLEYAEGNRGNSISLCRNLHGRISHEKVIKEDKGRADMQSKETAREITSSAREQ